jgi:hypothetical protein
MVDKERQAGMYEDALGRAARVRQEGLMATRHSCCGEHKDDGHHEACSKRPVEVAAPVIEGQETLA